MVCSPNIKQRTKFMENQELTIEQKMELAISKAKEQRKQAKDLAKLKLLEDEDYIGYKANIAEEAEEVTKLTNIMEQLNAMKAIVTQDGTKYAVHCYPVAEYVFGPVMSRVLGIITASSAMFTDDRQVVFKIITNMPYLEVSKAREAIGSPAYYSKGTLSPAILGNSELIDTTITAVLVGLDIDLDYKNKLNKTNLNKWFTIAEDKADKQFAEFQQMEQIDSTNKFVLED